MSEAGHLSDAQTFAPAAAQALQAFAVVAAEVKLVNVSENVTFRVLSAVDGAVYVLRLHRPGYHTLAELESERVWIRALGAAGIAVPTPVLAPDGRDYVQVFIAAHNAHRYAGLARWTEGQMLDDLLRDSTDAGTGSATSPGASPGIVGGYFEQLGALIARMHNQASNWPLPAGFQRHAVDADGLLGDAPFWGPFWDHPGFTSEERALVLATRDELRGVLARYGRSAANYGLIHADLHPGNLLVDEARLTVIDFDDAGFGWHQYDVAVALVKLHGKPHFETAQTALLRGYRRVRALSAQDQSMIPAFLLIRRLATIGWVYQRPEHDGPYMQQAIRTACELCRRFVAPL